MKILSTVLKFCSSWVRRIIPPDNLSPSVGGMYYRFSIAHKEYYNINIISTV